MALPIMQLADRSVACGLQKLSGKQASRPDRPSNKARAESRWQNIYTLPTDGTQRNAGKPSSNWKSGGGFGIGVRAAVARKAGAAFAEALAAEARACREAAIAARPVAVRSERLRERFHLAESACSAQGRTSSANRRRSPRGQHSRRINGVGGHCRTSDAGDDDAAGARRSSRYSKCVAHRVGESGLADTLGSHDGRLKAHWSACALHEVIAIASPSKPALCLDTALEDDDREGDVAPAGTADLPDTSTFESDVWDLDVAILEGVTDEQVGARVREMLQRKGPSGAAVSSRFAIRGQIAKKWL